MYFILGKLQLGKLNWKFKLWFYIQKHKTVPAFHGNLFIFTITEM